MTIYFCATKIFLRHVACPENIDSATWHRSHFRLCPGLFVSLIYLFKPDEQLETESVRTEQGDHEYEAPSAVTRSEQLAVTSRYNTARS